MDFRGDDRAVSAVVGAVLVFGFLIILLSIYQAAYVPLQTERAEFDHSKEVQNDMVELRSAILSAGSRGEPAFSTVKLGTRYSVRLLAINPPPATGSLETSEPRPIRITDGDGNVSNLCPPDGPVETRTLRYTPEYSEYHNAPAIVYENTVLYLDFGDRTIPLTDQRLVRGNTVTVRPLSTSFRESGVDSVSVESVPGNVNDREVRNATVTYPTDLSEETWKELLAGQVDSGDVEVNDGELTVETTGRVRVSCSPTGLNEAPPGGQRRPSEEINPAGPGDVILQSVTKGENASTVNVTFNNTGAQETSITQIRMSFYFTGHQPNGRNEVDPYDVRNSTTVFGDDFSIGEPLQTLDPHPRLPGNDTETTISFEFGQDEKSDSPSQRDFFVIDVRFDNGARGTYFVNVPS